MSFRRIVLAFLILSKLIADIIFSVCGTPTTLGLYTLIIYIGPLYVWIIITAISGLTNCHDYEAGLISLLTIKYTRVATFRSYRS